MNEAVCSLTPDTRNLTLTCPDTRHLTYCHRIVEETFSPVLEVRTQFQLNRVRIQICLHLEIRLIVFAHVVVD